MARVQGAAVVTRRGLPSPVCLDDRSGENVLLRKGTESRPPGAAVPSSRRNPAASGQVPHPSSQSPKSAFFQRVPNPRSPISPSSISGCIPARPFCTSPRLVSPPRLRFPFSAAGHSSRGAPRLRSTPVGACPRRSPFPASGPLLRTALRLRFPFSASGPPLWYLPEQVSLPHFGSSLRPPAHCPRAPSPQARSLRLGSPSPGPSAL